MKTLMPYVIFSGNCIDALNFYKKCLNGDIVKIQHYSESPIFSNSTALSETDKNRIFDSEFRAGELVFKASDDLPNHQVHIGSNISLFVHFRNNEELESSFRKLSDGGKILFALNNNFGMLVDKFSIRWMLSA